MERIIDRNGKKRRITIMAIPVILLLFVIGVLGYGFCIYNGYLLLNNPSKKQYPVSGIDLSHYQGEVDWPVLAQQNIMFAYIKATEGSSHTDARFAYNWEESGKTDLAAGAYHFFSFDSSGDTQADHFIHTVGNRSGMLPPAVDVEYYADKKVIRRTRSLCGSSCRLCWTGLRNIIINLPFSILQKMYGKLI